MIKTQEEMSKVVKKKKKVAAILSKKSQVTLVTTLITRNNLTQTLLSILSLIKHSKRMFKFRERSKTMEMIVPMKMKGRNTIK